MRSCQGCPKKMVGTISILVTGTGKDDDDDNDDNVNDNCSRNGSWRGPNS
jgi:hypothetical protein